ncbi:hypothetical protein DL766_008240 [Monosporascus sp. MC13-8B]|uniref:ASTRA-associated protein 1 n=1 Tax=Monosporascus cannonballus TaxID=155416 RepID=A0ABY0GSX1_9PEZI|nr:hypothetical protein DL762_009587 [Monosporascus cannonballus]RYO98108.1 hypothetical protein DL763_002428 [Monosporascus cannonballus]RYP20271.1 hypothetical protein DL766_008240 [Monosporascus sp. MC13-8B]
MTSQRPAAQPKSVLRGHKAQVHATTFVRSNQRLASGDAEGFVVLWDLTIMRPSAVWRAHEKAILGIAGWGKDKIITHGRDNRLVVWKVAAEDEPALSIVLPLDQSVSARAQPWILHVLEVNTMNFCSFAQCTPDQGPANDELLIAVPNTLSSESHSVTTSESVQEDRLATTPSQAVGAQTSLLSTALDSDSRPTKPAQKTGVSCKTLPTKAINTKHSGQQGLRIRSDGKIFATAGWDSKVRVYSTKTMSELAVLKWHDVGCYTTAFTIVDGRDSSSVEMEGASETQSYEKPSDKDRSEVEVVPRLGGLSVRDRRIKQAKEAHWLAVGSKDGKISLWDIY